MASKSTAEIKKEIEQNENVAADFETAIKATGLGLYNLHLLLVAFTGAFGNTFATTTISFVLPVAECDLKLSLQDKGLLNAAVYAGMILSALFWGYLADTRGRKKLLVYCYLGDAICVFMSSLSQNTGMLVAFKVLGGIIVNGPSAILYSYLTEMHSKDHRSHIILFIGMMVAFSTLMLPLLAWGIFPRDWNFILFDSLNIHSWQIYLLACALPSLLSSLLIMCLPESPKFLMSQGRNAEALCAFKRIFAINKRQPKENYPIKKLVEEVPSRDSNANEIVFTIDSIERNKENATKDNQLSNRDFMQSIRQGIQQMKPLFRKPLLSQALHVILLQLSALLSFNTIRLWLPQLFASVAEYEAQHSMDTSKNLCNVMEFSVNKTALVTTNYMERCGEPQVIPTDAYMNNIIAAISSTLVYFLGGAVVRKIDIKHLITFCFFICALLDISLYWSVNSITTLILTTILLSVGSVGISSILSVIVELFPTSLRTFIVATSLMLGRVGTLSGNLLFPTLIKLGCIPPFLFLSISMVCASILAGLLPNTKKASLT